MFPELRSFSGEPGNLVGTRTMTNSNVMTPVSRRHPVCPNSDTKPFKKSVHVHSRNTSRVSKERSSSVPHSFPNGPTQGQLQVFTHRGGCADFSADALACPVFRKEMPLWGPDFFFKATHLCHILGHCPICLPSLGRPLVSLFLSLWPRRFPWMV